MGAGAAPVLGVPESTPTSRPFSLTIRLKTSATERTPWMGFQSYLPDMTRASPVNLSESVPASLAKAVCNPAGCDCACALLIAHSWLLVRSRYLRGRCLPVVAEYRQFHTCIVFTMMLLFTHDASIGSAARSVDHAVARARRGSGP